MNKLDKHQMFLDNEKLIYFTMKKYFPHIYNNLDNREDYYQIGAIGLLKAIDNYKSNIAAFSTYAIPVIWGEIKRNIRDKTNQIHYSRKIIDISNKLMSTYNENEIKIDYDTWINMEINKLDISYSEKLGIINYIFKPINLDTYVDDKEKLTMGDYVPSTESVSDDVEYILYIENIANRLNDKEKRIFLEFLKGEKQICIGDKIGMSQAQVSRIQKKIKMLTIKQLYESEQYELAINKLHDMFKSDNLDLYEICSQYQIDLSKCPKNILEKRINNMQQFNQKIYSKKSCQKIILKCVMKLILKNKTFDNNYDFKQSVKKLLITNNYNNESIFNHLESMMTSQITSCINFAKKNIEKYDYKHEYEIVINELDFSPLKFIKKEYYTDVKINKTNTKNNDTSSNNLIDKIISILDGFRRDNLMIRF